jgi:hypothetical protein
MQLERDSDGDDSPKAEKDKRKSHGHSHSHSHGLGLGLSLSTSSTSSSSFNFGINPEFAAQLLSAADRFQIPQLIEVCATKLIATIAVDNVADRLILADTCHAPRLKRKCLEFVRADSRRLAEVMDTDGFQRLSRAQLHELMAVLAPTTVTAATTTTTNSRKRTRDSDAATPEDIPSPVTKSKVKKLKLSELRAELESRGMDTSGLKEELVERLENALPPFVPVPASAPPILPLTASETTTFAASMSLS